MSVYTYNVIVYQSNPFNRASFDKVLSFRITKQISDGLIITIYQKIKQDSLFKNDILWHDKELYNFHFLRQLTIKEKEKLHQIIKPIIQRYQ